MKIRIPVCIMLVFAAFLSLVSPAAVKAADVPEFKISSSPANISVGDITTITISGKNITDMYACEVTVQFDSACVQFVSGNGFGGRIASMVNVNQIIFAATKTGNIQGDSGNINICSLSFTGIGTGTAAFVLKSVKVLNSNLQENKYSSSETASISISAVEEEPAKNDTKNDTKEDEVLGEIKPVDVKVDIDGIAKVSVQTAEIAKVLAEAKESTGKEAEKLVINVPEKAEAKAYEVELPAVLLTSKKSDLKIELKTDTAILVLPTDMLEKTGVETEASKVSVTVAEVDKSTLDETVAKVIGSRPVIDLSVKVDDKVISWNNPDAKVEVSIPYTPTAEGLKNYEHLIVYYIDHSGNVIPVRSAKYDQKTGLITMEVTHFSLYAVAYVFKTFDDIGRYDWAKREIEVIASKGIIEGDGGRNFMPGINITRADFMMMLVQTFGLSASFENSFEDVTPDDYYYEAVNAARKLGLAEGDGNNHLMPETQITRQDMMVLCAGVMKLLGKIELEGSHSDLKGFTDREQVADYAVESLATMVKAGFITGDTGMITPLRKATRAEAAVLMYRMYNYK